MSDRPRIVHVYKDVWPPVQGGIERIVALLARRAAASGFDVQIIIASRSRRGGRRTLDSGGASVAVNVNEVPSYGRWLSTPAAPGFISALCRSRADLLHFHVPHPTGELAYLLSGLTTPAVATYHSDVVRQRLAMAFYRPIFDRFLRRMRIIMPTSRRYLESSAALAMHRDRCRVVPLGYPLEEYAATDPIQRRAGELRAQYGEFVLFLGCLRAYKGLPFLLEALHGLPGVRSVIAGDGAEGPRLRRLAAELSLGDRALFLGEVSQEEGVALLHAAALFVLPAHQRSEAFGLCQIEAMACGLPVISTDLQTGVPEVNVHGETGLIVPPADTEGLRMAIGKLLNDPVRRAAMGEAGRRRAFACYAADRMCDEVEAIYREVLKKE